MEVIAPSYTTDSKRSTRTRFSGRRTADTVLVALFLAGIYAPLLGVQRGRHGWDIETRHENRGFAKAPMLLRAGELHLNSPRARLKALLKFPGESKYYVSDHYGFRNLLIRSHGELMVNGLGVTSNHAVILGKEGWLYLANDGSLEDWRNIDLFTSDDLKEWKQMLEERNAFCAARGIPYLFVVAPSKYDIYPQYMPDNLTRIGTTCRLDQLLDYLRQTQSPVHVLDLRPALLKAREDGTRLFQKTDTHWNDRGAWVAYQAIMDAVKPLAPNVRILDSTQFEPVVRVRPGMDLAGILGLNDVLVEESLDLKPRIPLRLSHVVQDSVDPITAEASGAGHPRVVIFRDSFMTMVLPFIAESFGRGVFFWEDGFDERVVEQEKPDIVIQQIAQRKLMRPAKMLFLTQPVQFSLGRWQLAGPSVAP